MRRMVMGLGVLAVVLLGLLMLRLRLQAARAEGPPGGSGEVEGRDIDLSTRLTARVTRWAVKEGDAVSAGALLLELDCADADAQVVESEARFASARAQAAAAAASVQASRSQREAAAAAQIAARAQAGAIAAQRDAARRQATRLEALANDVAASNRDQTQASAEGLERQAEAAAAQARASEEQSHAAVAAIQASGAQAVAAEAQMKAAESAVTRARLLSGECRVVSPIAGVVDVLPHEVGELVPAGQLVARVVALDDVKVTFYLPNAELASARPGGKAKVIADAWPGAEFEGRIVTVAAKAEFTPRNIQTRTDRDRLVYPIQVSVPNPEHKLRPGMPVQVALVESPQ